MCKLVRIFAYVKSIKSSTMLITNEFIKQKTGYNRSHHCNLTRNQLQFVNELDFEEYGSGWQFLKCLNFCWWNFASAIKVNLLTYEYNYKVNGWDKSEHESYINLVKKYGFDSIEFNEDIEYLFKD